MMKKLKKFLVKKKIFVICGFSFFVLFLFFMAMSLYGSWWKIWPSGFRFNVALNRLAISVYSEPYCHVDCYLKRQVYQEEIKKSLSKEKLRNKVAKIIFAEEENINWRLELLNIVLNNEDLSTWSLFSDLKNYLEKEDGNLRVQSIIANNLALNNLDLSYLKKLQVIIMDKEKNIEERLTALKMLGSKSNSLADFYLLLLDEENNDDLKIEALRALGSDEARFDLDKKVVGDKLKNIILTSNSSFTTRRLAIFVWSDFLSDDFSDDMVVMFMNLISDDNLDLFSKYFVLDILQNKFPTEPGLVGKYVFPEISQGEWDAYYKQK